MTYLILYSKAIVNFLATRAINDFTCAIGTNLAFLKAKYNICGFDNHNVYDYINRLNVTEVDSSTHAIVTALTL